MRIEATPLEHAAREIVNAIQDEGIAPNYHRQQLRRLKREWPTLYYALRHIERVTPPDECDGAPVASNEARQYFQGMSSDMTPEQARAELYSSLHTRTPEYILARAQRALATLAAMHEEEYIALIHKRLNTDGDTESEEKD